MFNFSFLSPDGTVQELNLKKINLSILVTQVTIQKYEIILISEISFCATFVIFNFS